MLALLDASFFKKYYNLLFNMSVSYSYVVIATPHMQQIGVRTIFVASHIEKYN